MQRLDEAIKYLWNNICPLDKTAKMLFADADVLYGMDKEETERWQINAARERFAILVTQVDALSVLANDNGISKIEVLNDLIPLLFQHTQYKSYPMSLLEKGRFDLLTQWLNGLTSVDLSGIDASSCESIDAWLDLLESKAGLQMFHTSGTTGKLSFFPRTSVERDLWMISYLRALEGFGDQPGVTLGFDGVRVPCIYPSVRNGRYVAQRIVKFLSEYVAPSPDQCYAMSSGTLSADLVSLSGRVRVAQSKGELGMLKISDPMRLAFKKYMEEQAKAPEETKIFMSRMMTDLKGQRVFLASQTSYLVKAAEEGLVRGISGVFSPNSVGAIGGGGKGIILPDNWQEMISEFTGIPWFEQSYGMTEMIGNMPLCEEGYYHIAPYYIPFLLDPESGNPLPRTGRQTGRFACLDLLAHSYWGGIVSGDKMTIEWDRQCGCRRKGAHIHNDVSRYSDAVTGDDKITCSATIDNTDAALQAIVNI